MRIRVGLNDEIHTQKREYLWRCEVFFSSLRQPQNKHMKFHRHSAKIVPFSSLSLWLCQTKTGQRIQNPPIESR